MVSTFGAPPVQPEEPDPASPMSLPTLGGVAPPEQPVSPMQAFTGQPAPPVPPVQQPVGTSSQGFDTALQPLNLPIGVMSQPDAPVGGTQSVQSATQDTVPA